MRFFLPLLAVFGLWLPCLQAENSPSKKTICLNMIVKNEKHVIERCLASALPIIDYWVIVDTGSEDGTQETIREYMRGKGVPGELHERPWVDFAFNRNEAMAFAKGKADYLLFIDADDYFDFEPGFSLPDLDKDYYYIPISHSALKYPRIHLVNNHLKWEYQGVVHEAIGAPSGRTWGNLEKVLDVYTQQGARTKDPQKYLKDAALLEAAVEKDPDNSRNFFYLAQSYRDAGESLQAIKNYEKRANMGGSHEEVFCSLAEIGIQQEKLNMPFESIVNSYQRAFLYRNSRVEPLYFLASYYRRNQHYLAGYKVAKLALSIPRSTDRLFVQSWMHDYGFKLEMSIDAYALGNYAESQQLTLELLRKQNLPEYIKNMVVNNLGMVNGQLLNEIIKEDQLTISYDNDDALEDIPWDEEESDEPAA